MAPLSDVAQVIVPDQRGHGRSDAGSPIDWNLSTWAFDIRRLCDVLGVDRPVILGVSFGGFVAQQYASTFPEDIAGLILVSTAPRYPGADEVVARARALRGAETAEALRRNIENPTEKPSAEDQQRLRSLYEQHPDPELDTLEPYIVRTPEVAQNWVPKARQTMDLRAGLQAVQCPTLAIVGELDPLNSPTLGAEVVASIPSGRGHLEIVPGAAHRVLTDNPQFTTSCIREFVRGLA